MALNSRVRNTAPLDYTTPPWPSLYWPYRAKPGVANYLYYARDIWRYTLLWTLVTFGVVHLLVAAYAVLMQLRLFDQDARGCGRRSRSGQRRSSGRGDGDGDGDDDAGSAREKKTLRRRQWKRRGPSWAFVCAIPVVYGLIGSVEAVMAGSFVGLILGAVYNAGYFRMSTWIPFVWSLINVLVLIVSSFSIEGAL